MKTVIAERSRISFRGVLRTSQGSTILTAVENMPISPVGTSGFAQNVAYKRLTELPKGGEGVVVAVTVVETLDYYPYGSIRLDNKVGGYSGEKRKYIGQE